MAELQPSKLATRVRFPSPAPNEAGQGGVMAAAADSKSAVRKYVRVRVPPLAPARTNHDWRGVRVVDGATLERLCGRKSTGGSNPPPSASPLKLANALALNAETLANRLFWNCLLEQSAVGFCH